MVGALATAHLCRRLGTEAILGGVTWERLPIDPHPGPRSADEILDARADRTRRDARRSADAHHRRRGVRRVPHGQAARRGDGPGGRRHRSRRDRGRARAGGRDSRSRPARCSSTSAATCSERHRARPCEPALRCGDAGRGRAAAAARDAVLAAVFGPCCDGELTPEELLAQLALARGRPRVDRQWRRSRPRWPTSSSAPCAEVPTEASAQAVRCARGELGLGTIRAGRRTVPLSPLGATTVYFDADRAVTGVARLARMVLDARDLDHAHDAAERGRRAHRARLRARAQPAVGSVPCPGSRPRRSLSPPGTIGRPTTPLAVLEDLEEHRNHLEDAVPAAARERHRSSCTTRPCSCGWRTRSCWCRASLARRSARRYVAAWYRADEVHTLSPPMLRALAAGADSERAMLLSPAAWLHGAGGRRQQPAAAASQPSGGGQPAAAPRMAGAGRSAALLGAGTAPARRDRDAAAPAAACRSRRERGTRRCWRAASSTCSPRARVSAPACGSRPIPTATRGTRSRTRSSARSPTPRMPGERTSSGSRPRSRASRGSAAWPERVAGGRRCVPVDELVGHWLRNPTRAPAPRAARPRPVDQFHERAARTIKLGMPSAISMSRSIGLHRVADRGDRNQLALGVFRPQARIGRARHQSFWTITTIVVRMPSAPSRAGCRATASPPSGGRRPHGRGRHARGCDVCLQEHLAGHLEPRLGHHHVSRARRQHVRHVEPGCTAQRARHALLEQQHLDELRLGLLAAGGHAAQLAARVLRLDLAGALMPPAGRLLVVHPTGIGERHAALGAEALVQRIGERAPRTCERIGTWLAICQAYAL